MKVSILRASFAGKYSSTLKPFTSPAKLQAKLDASNLVMVAMPDRPASRLAQPSATVLPTGLTSPSPVTTTRRRVMTAPRSRSTATDPPRGSRPPLRPCSGQAWGGPAPGSSCASFELLCTALGLLVLDGVVDRQLHRGDLLGLFVGDLDAELVFEGHHQFHRVKRVGAQVGHEGFLVGHVGLGNAELLGDDFLDAGFDIAHDSSWSVYRNSPEF